MPGHQQELTITNDLASLGQVRDLIAASVRAGGFPDGWINRLQIAVDEAVTNIIEHGHQDRPRGEARIHLAADVDEDEFRITITDEGASFDPNTLDDVDIGAHVASGRNGGLGVFLMRRIMDLIDYHFENGRRNRLVLVKYRP
jgi:anti-sigma regulatory factor (Ser/Thr protein kinase)